jgi:hypothetical protein
VKFLYILPLLALASCATTQDKHASFPAGMSEDSQDQHNTKYNLMDSPDGRQDPNGRIKIWGAVY